MIEQATECNHSSLTRLDVLEAITTLKVRFPAANIFPTGQTLIAVTSIEEPALEWNALNHTWVTVAEHMLDKPARQAILDWMAEQKEV